MLIRRAEIVGRGTVLDVRIDGERIIAIESGLAPEPGEAVIDARGGALLPGLHDHHIHLLALAAAERSVRCGPPYVRSEEAVVAALRMAAAATPAGEIVRGVGYHESVAGPLDRHALDRWLPGRGVALQHRTGALWIVSSALVGMLGLDAGEDAPGVERDGAGRATGRLFRLDAWLRERLPRHGPPPLAGVGALLARRGVTGVTDTTPTNGGVELRVLEWAVEQGALLQRLVLMGSPLLPPPASAWVSRGAVKLQLDERELPDLVELVGVIAAAHREERAVAIHAVTRTELVFAAEAFREAGGMSGDRLEHASVAPPEVAALVAELGLTVVTQPNFVRERGEAYLVDVEARDQPWLYRCRGWDELHVPLGGGTDAPFGEPDPWVAMQSAVDRRTEDGHVIGRDEAVTPERALALFTTGPAAPGGVPRRVAPGELADLCLLGRPWRAARDRLTADDVRTTILGGRVTWDRDRESPP